MRRGFAQRYTVYNTGQQLKRHNRNIVTNINIRRTYEFVYRKRERKAKSFSAAAGMTT